MKDQDSKAACLNVISDTQPNILTGSVNTKMTGRINVLYITIPALVPSVFILSC